jgi:hypothetical protein
MVCGNLKRAAGDTLAAEIIETGRSHKLLRKVLDNSFFGHSPPFETADGAMTRGERFVWLERADPFVYALTLNLTSNPVIATKSTATIPFGSYLDGAAPSPDGRHIALLIDFPFGHPDPEWLETLKYRLRIPRKQGTFEIWTCEIDGSRMRPVGLVHRSTEILQTPVRNLGWMPDSKRISFVHNERLWTVPAN